LEKGWCTDVGWGAYTGKRAASLAGGAEALVGCNASCAS
jgi:hypothetical protein